jgi:aminoglycoside phosphotransferase (APT) family kinase protein
MIDQHLARRLVDAQFPQWAQLPIAPVALGGVDNRTFRLGDELSVRLPSADWYAFQVEKEQRWLPQLAPHLPLPIPQPVAKGEPGEGYPYAWSVYRWLEGENATEIAGLEQFATDLAEFLVALKRCDASGGPEPGKHNFFRGGPLSTYAHEVTEALDTLGDRVDRAACERVWDDAMGAAWTGDPVWFHGDVATGNLLVRDGRLAAVIDFGTSGVGDPACDVVIAWTLFEGESRATYREALGVDAGTWSRGRGWALWKALITLDGDPNSARVIERVLADYAE